LIRAFGRLTEEFPDWGLVILGEGTRLGELESLVAELGLTERVRLPGVLDNPFPTLKQADLFVLSSRSEGFGNVLVEAMACGLPVVATECWSRAPGIVRHGVDGILVAAEDVDALASAMRDLIADDQRRRQLGREAAQSAKRFDLTLVTRAWDQLLKDLVASRQRD
jgi:glycosyltransferase involved in cell wall biosynthesis